MPTDLETSNDDDQHTDDNPVIRELRQKANRTEVAESKVSELQRELVVHRAGLTELSDKQLKALSAAHEGDWEPEALKATAAELGFGTTTDSGQQEPEPKIPAEELAAHQRVAAAATGQPPAPPATLDAALANAKSEDEIKEILRNADMLFEP